MLRVQDICYKIGHKTLLEGITCQFLPGKTNLIIGPNGAGKSTLIRLLSGQLQPAAGAVFYRDKNIRNLSAAELARKRALLSQNVELAFPLRVAEVVMMGRYPHFSYQPSAYDHEICEAAMHFFDVAGMAERNYLTLSGGEMQRVHFARVAAQIWDSRENESRYLLLDEPLTYLDIYYQIDFMDKLMELVRGHNLVVVGVVHDLNLAGKYADHLVLLQNGNIIAQGTRNEVLTRALIREVYKMDVEVVDFKGSPRLFF